MKPDYNARRCLTVCLAGWLLIWTGNASADLFDKTPTITPAFSYAESRSDQYKVTPDPINPGSLDYELVGRNYSCAISARLPLAGLDIRTLSPDSPVSISLGSFNFQGTLGSADNYQPGQRTATFTIARPASDGYTERVILSWTRDVLAISVVGRSTSTESDLPLIADEYFSAVDAADPSSNSRTYQATVTFDALSGTRPVHARGGKTEKDRASIAIASIRSRGAVNFTPPALQVLRPARGASLPIAAPELVVKAPSALSVQAAVNGDEPIELEQLEDGSWTAPLPLAAGLNKVTITATDEDENTRVLPAFPLTWRPVDGLYKGLAASSPDGPAEPFSLRLSADGAFRGTISLAGLTYSFRGSFAAGDTTTASIPRRGAAPLQLSLSLARQASGANSLSGSVMVNGTTYALTGGRLLYDGRNVAYPHTGRATLAFSPAMSGMGDEVPQGSGWAAARVAATGVVTAAGRLADGTTFSFSGQIDGAGHLPVSVPLNGGSDYLAGTLSVSGADVSGSLTWHRDPRRSGRFKDGFTMALDARGSGYQPGYSNDDDGDVPPDGVGSVDITYAGNVSHLDLDPRGRISVTGSESTSLRLTLTNSTGVFSGTFYDQGGTLRSLSGVLLPSGGYGYSPTDAGSGAVELTTAP